MPNSSSSPKKTSYPKIHKHRHKLKPRLEKILSEKKTQTSEEQIIITLLKTAIAKGDLSSLDKKYLKVDYLKLEDERGFNILQHAALNKKLHLIPKYLLTEDLILGGHPSATSIHIAALEEQLEHIPKEFLTEKNLSKKDSLGRTTYEIAIETDQIKQIPRNLLTDEIILKKGGKSGLNLLEGLEDQMLWHPRTEKEKQPFLKRAKYLLNKLSTNNLKKLSKITTYKISFDKEIKDILKLRKELKDLGNEEKLNI